MVDFYRGSMWPEDAVDPAMPAQAELEKERVRHHMTNLELKNTKLQLTEALAKAEQSLNEANAKVTQLETSNANLRTLLRALSTKNRALENAIAK